jgi:hypothetical protein
MPTITMPPKAKSEEPRIEVSQKRPSLDRFRLQVDRQTKASFSSFEAAEKAAKAIKKAHPVVPVIVYDAHESSTKIIA